MQQQKILKKRISLVRKLLKQRGHKVLVVTNPPGVTYLTGFLGNDSWTLLTERAVYLLTDSRYTEQARNHCPACKIIERKGPITKTTAWLLQRYKSIKSAAVGNNISVAQLKELRKNAKKSIKPITDIVATARRTKDSSEIKAIEKAANLAANALTAALENMKPGITETALAGIIELEIRKLGAKASFDTIVAFGANASRPHHVSGKTKLKKNDTVLIDFGAKLNGYCCDITRCFTVGKQKKIYKRAYEAVRKAQAAAIEKVTPGATLKSVDKAAREVIRARGFEPHGHGTGHGLGLLVHELPVVAPQSKGRLKAGDVITIEPGIYIPGKLGIRIEDDILVTKTGYKTLTKIPS